MVSSSRGPMVWVASYPSHYNRRFNKSLEAAHPDEFVFIYVGPLTRDREYERGNFPAGSIFIESGVRGGGRLLGILRTLAPKAIVVSGHFPRTHVMAALWAVWHRVPVLYWSDTNLHDILNMPLISQWWRKLIFSWYFGRMTGLLYPGMRTRDYYVWAGGRGVLSKSFRLPYPFTALSDSKGRLHAPGDSLNVLYLGRLVPEKAVDRLLAAIAMLDEDVFPVVRLTIAGDGPDRRSLERICKNLGLAGKVQFLGPVPSDEVGALYSRADVFVLPSSSEPWGIVVAEAMSAGVPVICPFWVGAAADVLVDGVTGIVLRDNAPRDIAAAISLFARNRHQLDDMGLSGSSLVARGRWGMLGAVDDLSDALTGLRIIQ